MRLTEAQQAAVNELTHNLQIIACAGAGKTEVITRRIANILKKDETVNPENIVAFTFTNKAAESMKVRIKNALIGESIDGDAIDKMYVGTIHGFCLDVLTRFSDKFCDFDLLDTVKKHHFVRRFSRICGLEALGLSTNIHDIGLFDDCLDKMIYEYDNKELWDEEVKEAFKCYRDTLYTHKYIDFSLIVLEALEILKCGENAVNYAKKIRYLIVDEYQDVDDIQEKLIQLIVAYGANICVVGDDDQTIYQFRGSNANNMITFAQRYNNVETIYLDTNFRCASNIIDIANTVVSNNTNRLRKKMHTPADNTKGGVTWDRYDTAVELYTGLANQIQKFGQENYGSIAVLCRKGKYINDIVRVLETQHIPYSTNSFDFFFNGIYFRKYVETLRLVYEGVDKSKLYELWKVLILDEYFTIGFRNLRRASTGVISMSNMLRSFLDEVHFFDDDETGERQLHFSTLELILDDYDEIYGDQQLTARLSGVLSFLSRNAADEYKYHNFKGDIDDTNCVKIMTVHKAKGLEFDTVFIPNLQEGQFPAKNRGGKKYWHILGQYFEQNKDKYEADEEDERKLFYVAVTRAKNKLCLMWQTEKKPASVFLVESNESDSLQIPTDELVKCSAKTKQGSNYETNCQGERVYVRFDWSQLKRDLREPYEAALHGPRALRMGAHADIDRIYSSSDEELLSMARKAGLDIEKYMKKVVYKTKENL